jgi:hypothetical protein
VVGWRVCVYGIASWQCKLAWVGKGVFVFGWMRRLSVDYFLFLIIPGTTKGVIVGLSSKSIYLLDVDNPFIW